MAEPTPSDPWSPSWRPDPSGRRLGEIRTARRGMFLGLAVYALVAVAILVGATRDRELLGLGLAIGAPAVMLLGAGLASAGLGSRIDGLVTGLAFAVGMPVAAVASLVIGCWVLDGFAAGSVDMAGSVLRRAVQEALGAGPVVGLAAALWVVAVRRFADPSSKPSAE